MSLVAQAPTAAQWTAEHYEKAIHNSQPRRVMLVLEDQIIRAFLVAKTVVDEWELENIAVAPNVQRRGFGSVLLKEFVLMAQNEKSQAVFLEVRESNRTARKFYEKLGFEIAGRRNAYYSNPNEDAIVYRLTIS
jgi:[ribosomal protein S18]-alanine N-acetyltransferase